MFCLGLHSICEEALPYLKQTVYLKIINRNIETKIFLSLTVLRGFESDLNRMVEKFDFFLPITTSVTLI